MTGQSRDSAMQMLAQVGHPVYEVPLGATIPAYYGLVASRYMHEFGSTEADFAELAVTDAPPRDACTRARSSASPITVEDVLASQPIASPLKLLDCCPVSDGGCAFVVAASRRAAPACASRGTAQAHNAQHVSAAASLTEFGAGACAAQALAAAGRHARRRRRRRDLRQLHHHADDAARGDRPGAARPGRRAGAEGHFDADGAMPLNTARRAALVRPLRRRRRDGAPGGDASADDRARRRPPGATRRRRAAARRRRRAVVAREPGAGGAHERATRRSDWTQGGDGIAVPALPCLRPCLVLPARVLPGLRCRRARDVGRRAGAAPSMPARSCTARRATTSRALAPYRIVLVDLGRGLSRDGPRRSGSGDRRPRALHRAPDRRPAAAAFRSRTAHEPRPARCAARWRWRRARSP